MTTADSVSGRDAILRVFLKVFNEKLGYSGDHPHIAELERHLATQGKLETFKDVFRAVAGVDWEQERDGHSFYADELVQALSDALGKTPEGAWAWLDKAEDDFKSLLTVENFARWIREYLDSKGPNHRICFLVDEIGQFIGQDTHLMLNLQTNTENLGTACGGRAWVVVTSQEDIDAVLGEVRAARANDFSKIQGRFKTRPLGGSCAPICRPTGTSGEGTTAPPRPARSKSCASARKRTGSAASAWPCTWSNWSSRPAITPPDSQSSPRAARPRQPWAMP